MLLWCKQKASSSIATITDKFNRKIIEMGFIFAIWNPKLLEVHKILKNISKTLLIISLMD